MRRGRSGPRDRPQEPGSSTDRAAPPPRHDDEEDIAHGTAAAVRRGRGAASAGRHGRLRLHGRRPLPGLADRRTRLRPAPPPGARRDLRPGRGRRAPGRGPARLGGGRDRLAGPDRAGRRRPRRHLHPRRQPRRDRRRRARRGQARAVRETPRQHRRRGRAHDPGVRRGLRARPVGDGRLQLPPGARHRARPPHGGRGAARHAAACAGDVPPGLARGPAGPADLAAAQEKAYPARSATWAPTSSTSPSTWPGSRSPECPR